MYIPFNPTLTEVCRCIHNFLIFDPKHTLLELELVEAVLTCTHYVCFSEIEKIKNKKKINKNKKKSSEISIFFF